MTDERRLIYLSVGINFLFGIIIGMVLFYGQLRTEPSVFEELSVYDTAVSFGEFLQVSWLNMLWLFFIFLFHNLLPTPIIHPIMVLRGCCCSFSVMYILSFLGIKEAAVAVLPQCFSILPLMLLFSVKVVQKRRNLVASGREPFTLNRREVMITAMISLIAGGLEVAFFKILVLCFG